MMWFAFTPVLLYLLVEGTRKRPREEQKKDCSSTLGLAAALAFMTLLPTVILLDQGRTPFPPHPLFFIGITLGIAGAWFRALAMRTLGRFFSRNIGIQSRHRVVDTGCYRYIRHPGYLGTLGTFLGFALSTASWLAVAGNLFCFLIAYTYRMRVEEKALVVFFGSAYREYQARTWRLIPYLY